MKNISLALAFAFVSFAAVNGMSMATPSQGLIDAVAAKIVTNAAKDQLSTVLPEQIDNLNIVDAEADKAIANVFAR